MGRAIRLGALLLLAGVTGCTAPGDARRWPHHLGRRPLRVGRRGRRRRGERPTAGDPRRADGAAPRGHRHPPHAGRRRRRPAQGAGPGGGRPAHQPVRHLPVGARPRRPGGPAARPHPAPARRCDPRPTPGSLIAPAGARRAALPGVQDYEVASVLVHDLRFTVRAADPPALAAAIAREGILTDALGSYSTSGRGGRLDITYTGPLLSDALVEVVRGGIARGEGVPPSSVTLAPRSTTGVGVTLADEPAPAPVVDEVAGTRRAGPPRPGLAAAGHGPGAPAVAVVVVGPVGRHRRRRCGVARRHARAAAPPEGPAGPLSPLGGQLRMC